MSEDLQNQRFDKRKISTDVTRDASPQILLFKAIDRKAFAAANGDLEGWQSAINEIFAQLPLRVKQAIQERENEYLLDNSRWEAVTIEGDRYSSNPKNPNTSNERGTLRYNPKFNARWYDVEYNEDGTTKSVKERFELGGRYWISPRWVVEPEKTDYTTLNHVLHEEMEMGKLTWKHERDDIYAPGRDIYPRKAQKPKPSPMT